MKGVMHLAAKDIRNYLKKSGLGTYKRTNNEIDVYTVTPSLMNNKRTRYLNKLLGLNKINYFGSKMDRSK